MLTSKDLLGVFSITFFVVFFLLQYENDCKNTNEEANDDDACAYHSEDRTYGLKVLKVAAVQKRSSVFHTCCNISCPLKFVLIWRPRYRN